MSLYDALTQYRNQWVALRVTDGSCFHGFLEEVKPEYIKLKAIDSNLERSTDYVRMDTILRFCTDAKPLHISQIQAAYYLDDGGDNDKEKGVCV